MDLALEGKTVVVTGGAGSLGTVMIESLVEMGARCAVPVRDMSELDDFPYTDHQQVMLVNGIDLSDEHQSEHFYNEVMEHIGVPWAVINLAGGFGMGTIEQTHLDDLEHQMKINAYTCFNSCRAAIELMRSEGQGGRIVNITSRPGIEPRNGGKLTAYASSKAAVAALTQSLGAELKEEPILVNAIAPSIIDTAANRNAMPGADSNRWVDPQDIVHQILFLISPRNKATSGAIIPVYGGS